MTNTVYCMDQTRLPFTEFGSVIKHVTYYYLITILLLSFCSDASNQHDDVGGSYAKLDVFLENLSNLLFITLCSSN